MLVINEKPEISDNVLKNALSALEAFYSVSAERICFFDIETTGLSSKVSNVYLIGAVIVKDGRAELTQIFADDYESEKKLLEAFAEMLESVDAVVHFNGTTFDIPYLEDKYRAHDLSSPFVEKTSIDIYKIVSKKRYIFPTENCKLTSIEKFTGFDRGEDSDGGECIQIYTDYMKHKYARNEEQRDECYKTLLKHNRDDLIGTVTASQVILYVEYFGGEVSTEIHSVEDDKEGQQIQLDFSQKTNELTAKIKIALSKEMYFPTGLIYNYVPEKSRRKKGLKTVRRAICPNEYDGQDSSKKLVEENKATDTHIIDKEINKYKIENNTSAIEEKVYFVFWENSLYIEMPVIEDTLYHFFSDYKEYFYLPDEDMAVHKSVGTYVDKSHREQASAANCYVKKKGEYIPVPPGAEKLLPESIDYFYDLPKRHCYIAASLLENAEIGELLAEAYLE